MKVSFFGAYEASYPRHEVIRKGLMANGIELSECRVKPGAKSWIRYPLLAAQGFKVRRKVVFVPEFCQKDVPLARFLSWGFGNRVVFDPLATRFETKILDWQRKPEGSLAAWWNYKIDSWAFRLSHLILADTQAHKEYFCRSYGLPEGKVAVLPVGYDETIYAPSSGPAQEGANFPATVLFFGSFVPLHGVETVVQAAALIFRQDPSLRFRLIGSGQTMPRARSLASELGLQNIEFKGWLPQPDLVREIASSDICLGIFGRTEKARRVVPHKVFQAMGMKKPVVTLQTPAAREFFRHRENIYLCSSPDPECLAKAILELRKDESLRRGIAARGYDLVRAKYSTRPIGLILKTILENNLL